MRWLDRDRVAARMRGAFLVSLSAAVGLIASLGGNLYAALPPQHEIWRQFGLITTNAEIPRTLGAYGMMERIERVGDEYRVGVANCYVPIKMVPIAPSADTPTSVGPAQIKPVVGSVLCPIRMMIPIRGQGGEK